MSWDKAHFNSPAHQESDRMADERDEAQERADRFAEKGPQTLVPPEFAAGLIRAAWPPHPAHPAQED